MDRDYIKNKNSLADMATNISSTANFDSIMYDIIVILGVYVTS